MFEVLMFLFENFMDGNVSLKADNETIVDELEQVGFDRFEIGRALEWLDGLSRYQTAAQEGSQPNLHGYRYYLPEELEHIGVEGCNFLMYLERIGVLDAVTREVVVDRLMALELREVHLGSVKWVVLMALFNQPDKKPALSLLQNMILADGLGVLH